jgi:hypothetical protein
MAIMIPEPLSDEIRTDYMRHAECKVYDRLKEILDTSFTVYYSRPWLGIRQDGSEIDGECDFVIAHPDHGILVIEVKGGGIEYHADTNTWKTIDRYHVDHDIKDPVKQARDGKYQILEKLKASKHYISWIPASYGVIFPDAKQSGFDLGIDRPREIFCFKNDFEGDLKKWVLSRFDVTGKTGKQQHGFGRSGMNALHDILAKPFQLHAPLISYLKDDEKSISLLTNEQCQTLIEIDELPRVIIRGGAGTGKTVLAMEEAVRRAHQGLRVLLTCYNKPLAAHLNQKIGSEPNIMIRTFHTLCAEAVEKAALSIPEGISETDKFRNVYPELFLKSLQVLKKLRFDVIIIDEGQDFLPSWINALENSLDPTGKKFIRIFYDSNQRIYNDYTRWGAGFELSPIKLSKNLRNTKRIHNLVKNFYSGHLIEARGPLGQDIEFISAETETEIRERLSEKVTDLIRNESANPGDIAILTESKSQFDLIAPKGKISGYKCQPCETFTENAIVLDTIRRFKGLENMTVIIIISAPMFLEEELFYIAFSRARAQLIILGTNELQLLLSERIHEEK